MIALTSISPNRIDRQKECIKTWLDHGFKVVSFNDDNGIYTVIESFPDIEVIATKNTLESLYKKPYVCLDVFFDYIKNSKEKCFIINSDIELINMPDFSKKMEEGIIVVNREDYDTDIKQSSKWDVGFDIFFIDKKFIDLFTKNKFALGQCHYDYWIPYRAMRKDIKVFNPLEKFAYHKKHSANNQYANGNWKKTALHLIELEGMNYTKNETGCWEMNKEVFKLIQSKSSLI